MNWNCHFILQVIQEQLKKTKYYFDNLLEIIWEVNMTYDDYLKEIIKHKNIYFDINYNELALNQLNLKQLMDLRIKNKDCMKNLLLLNHNEEKILRDLSNMETIHKKQIKTYNTLFDENEDTTQTHATNFRTYFIMVFNKVKQISDNNMFMRYAIKLEIDFEIEKHKREGIIFDWKCKTYDNINM
jgi:hypothetical protein